MRAFRSQFIACLAPFLAVLISGSAQAGRRVASRRLTTAGGTLAVTAPGGRSELLRS